MTTEKNGNGVKKWKDYIALILAIIAILGFLSNVFTMPGRIEVLEKELEKKDVKIEQLERTVISVHERVKAIETMTRQLHDHFLKKGMDSK